MLSPIASGPALAIDFAYAFQPIVDTQARAIVSYEALIRGPQGQSAFTVLEAVPADHKHEFDSHSRALAIEQAMRLGLDCNLNLNFLPQSLFASSAPLAEPLETAQRCKVPLDRLVIEITEGEVIHDLANFSSLMNVYRSQGIKLAIDDFGAGYAGLNLLAEFQPDQIKIDMALVRGIESNGPRQAIVRAILGISQDLGIDVIAEGVETLDEYRWFHDQGVSLYQGYLFAKPGFGCLPEAIYPG